MASTLSRRKPGSNVWRQWRAQRVHCTTGLGRGAGEDGGRVRRESWKGHDRPPVWKRHATGKMVWEGVDEVLPAVHLFVELEGAGGTGVERQAQEVNDVEVALERDDTLNVGPPQPRCAGLTFESAPACFDLIGVERNVAVRGRLTRPTSAESVPEAAEWVHWWDAGASADAGMWSRKA